MAVTVPGTKKEANRPLRGVLSVLSGIIYQLPMFDHIRRSISATKTTAAAAPALHA